MNFRHIDKKRGAYFYEVHYNYEFLEDFQDLFEDQGPKFSPDSGIHADIGNVIWFLNSRGRELLLK